MITDEESGNNSDVSCAKKTGKRQNAKQKRERKKYIVKFNVGSNYEDDSRLSKRAKKRKIDYLIQKKVRDAVEQLHMQTLVTNQPTSIQVPQQNIVQSADLL